jgi:hypothetical protein
MAKRLSSLSVKSLRLALLIFLIFFMLVFSVLFSALMSVNFFTFSSRVVTPSVGIDSGVIGEVSLADTHDYGKVNITAGFTFYENSSVQSGINTDFVVTGSSGSFTLLPGFSATLYSPPLPSSVVVFSGSWVLDAWVSADVPGTLDVAFSSVDSSGGIVAVAASGSTQTIGTSMSEVKTSFNGSQIAVPSGGYLVANITNNNSSNFTIYWGLGQATNFQTPKDYDYVLKLTNNVSSDYSVNLLVYNYSGINRLTNMTVSLYSPSMHEQEIIIANGALIQDAGTAVTLTANSELYISVTASANMFGTSHVILLIKVPSMGSPFFYDTLNFTVN